jgi:hypothetical protein
MDTGGFAALLLGPPGAFVPTQGPDRVRSRNFRHALVQTPSCEALARVGRSGWFVHRMWFMSPVSRSRKPKKAKRVKSRGDAGRAAPRTGAQSLFGDSLLPAQQPVLTALAESLGGGRSEAEWYAEASSRVLDETGGLLRAGGPCELETATAVLLGAELYAVVHGGAGGLWFGAWFEHLAQAAAGRVRAGLEGAEGSWEGAWRLLHGMAAIGSPALRSAALRAMNTVGKQIHRMPHPPGWLGLLPKVAATGEVRLLRDPYLPRFGVLAEFTYPGGADRHVYLWDADGCAVPCLAGAGVHDDWAQAAATWRSAVGETAERCAPEPLVRAADLECLAHLGIGEEMMRGTESREVLNEWYRAERRLHELDRALRRSGQAVPTQRSLYEGVETEWAEQAFGEWYAAHNGGRRPDPEGVGALAAEWLEGALPGTGLQPSPHRVHEQYVLIHDWMPGHPVTVAAHELFPEWIRFLVERGGYPQSLAERAVATAITGERKAADCPIDDYS